VKHVLCWKVEEAFAIINPDADALTDHVFRAVHTDVPVRIRSGDSGGVRVVKPEKFLEELLRPKDHALVPVIGHSGTGKSHLIRWLDLRLRDSAETQEVIYVPKAQTNLREIVRSIVKKLPPEDQEGYLNALAVAGGAALSPEAQRTAILNQLHLALVNDTGGADRDLDPEMEEYVLGGLRAMLSDPHLRKSLLMDHGFAADLAAHVFEKPERYEPAEGRREFREQDLPLDVLGIKKAAQETQDFLSWLLGASSTERRVVVDLVNRHLDWAIANCLNMTGDRVIELMLDLRRHIRAKGRELVLLIEDFARLQGLDRALLQSIIEQRADLCVLRTVFASTGGFYQSIRETVRTRFTFIVDMDAEADDAQPQLDSFVARYLNAVRWGETALREQWGEVQSGRLDFHVPSKCADCQYQEGCHHGFGAVQGMGLYPLTAQAIQTMAERADPKYRQSFNPRNFQKYTLRPVALAGEALRAGQFPPASLLADLGGGSMNLAQQQRMQRDDPVHWVRRLALLELWGGGGEIRNLSPALHEAFDLPPLAHAETTHDLQPQKPLVGRSLEPAVSVEDERLRELQQWKEERVKLSTGTAQALRELVFAALEEFIDWDDVGLAKSAFFGRRSAGRIVVFRSGDVGFHNQATNFLPGRYQLRIPATWADEAERSRVTMALQGLLEAKASGGWAFPDGLDKLACLGECLREWSQDLIRQFRASDAGAAGQEIAAAAFEVRACLQILLNPTLPAVSDQDVLKGALAAASESTADFATADLNALATEMAAQSDALLDTVRTRYSATKGGAAGDFMDTARLLPLAKALRRQRLLPPKRALGSVAKSDLADPLRHFLNRCADLLPAALAKEAAVRESAKGQLYESFGERVTRESVLQFVHKLAEIAGGLGISGALELQNSGARFEGIAFEEVLRSLRSADASKLDLRDLRSGVGQGVGICADVIRLSNELLSRTEGELSGRLTREGVDPQSKTQLVTELRADLVSLGLQLARYHDDNTS
jgi:hypothetical protein